MKRINRIILKSSASWHETCIRCSSSEAYDVQKTPISEFRLLVEDDGGEWHYFKDESSLEFPIYVVYTKKHGRIILKDESVSFNKGLLYWEEGERTGNFLYFSKGDTDYDVINLVAYGKKARMLTRHVVKFLTPVLSGGTLENRSAKALISEGDDADEGIESETGA